MPYHNFQITVTGLLAISTSQEQIEREVSEETMFDRKNEIELALDSPQRQIKQNFKIDAEMKQCSFQPNM